MPKLEIKIDEVKQVNFSLKKSTWSDSCITYSVYSISSAQLPNLIQRIERFYFEI